MNWKRTKKTALAGLLSFGGIALAQFEGGDGLTPGWGGNSGGGGRRGGGGFGGGRNRAVMQDLATERNGIPSWNVDSSFKNDVFTFVRVMYSSGNYGRGGSWATDYPDSDLNFSYRLQQMTSIKVDPVPKQIRLTDETLFDYPFIYMLEIGRLEFQEEEIAPLRRYLLNGGFLMVDDHWGVAEYENFHREMLRVFPEREPEELELDHPIFSCVFKLKEKPQIPAVGVALANRDTGITYERYDAKEAHYRAIKDDKGRVMVLICSNTDLGDGWEREGDNEWYFHEFSEKKAYPMGINIIFYAMTH